MLCTLIALLLAQTTYDVGSGQPLPTIGSVPWASLGPGDLVRIHYRAAPYAEKWVICRQGTSLAPITVRGVAGPNGELPVITGDGAIVASGLNYWNEDRGVLKIGGANTPPDTMPAWIVVENLEIRSARAAYSFTGDDAAVHAYLGNASAIYVEKGQNLTIRNCVFRDCGNGFFTASQSSDVLVEGCRIYDNGNTGSIFEHNNYTESNGIVFQYNWFGPLRAGCPGNNLKDRSAGCVVRYNWIEGGNRQLDLVDSDTLYTDPDYDETFVYGNVLVEPDGAGNSQIVHYGGDSGTTAEYRLGTLYFHHNTVISTRLGNTTLFRLSSAGETCDARNNIVYVTAAGSALAILDQTGTVNLRNNWFKTGWSQTHSGGPVSVNDLGGQVTGTLPGFVDFAAQDFRLAAGSTAINAGTALDAAAVLHDAIRHYLKHQASEARLNSGAADLGAYELGASSGPGIPGGAGGGGGGGGGGGSGGGGCGATGGMGTPVLAALLLLLRRRPGR